MMKEHYDVAVIGAGPAGTMAAGLVAEAGFSTLLIERHRVPRFHVGESLMPETYWPLERLGVIERMKQSRFTRKHSVQFVSNRGGESDPFFFQEHDPRESSITWQVERADFDKMLFDRAGELGADCYDATRLIDLQLQSADQSCNVLRLQTSDGQSREVTCKVVIDGSGQQSIIANKLGLKRTDPNLKKAAIWSYWRGAIRDPGDNAGATIIMHTDQKQSWFWFIPLADGITSIGCVGDHDYILRGADNNQQRYDQEVARCPGLLPRLSDAHQVGEVHVAKEYTYSTTQHAGDGWVLVGDAFGFIDPIYSSGVYFALVTGERAADAVIAGLRGDDTSAQQLGSWCDDFKQGSRWLRKLVDAFYTNEFSFGGFMRDNPQFRGNLTDLLIGRIFEPGVGDIFDEMDPAMLSAKSATASSSPPH
jgi:flavin-dependent dehydrogenase